LVLTGNETADVSLDPTNSPPVTYTLPSYQGDACLARVIFGFLDENYQLINYGVRLDGSGNPTVFTLSKSTFGQTSCVLTSVNIHGAVAGFGWVGRKIWIVGGDSYAGKF